MRDRIGYLHVPKAAGSSVVDALRRAVLAEGGRAGRPVEICPQVIDRTLFGGFDRFELVAPPQRRMIHTGPPEDLARFDVVVGHFATSSLLAGRRHGDLAVVLREPRARLLSHYAYWSGFSEAEHAGWDPYDASRRAAACSWSEYLLADDLAAQTDNVAARLLVGPHARIPPDGFIAEDDLDAVLADALSMLGRVGFVDAVEHGAEGWERLGRWAGLELDVGRRNVTALDEVASARWGDAESVDAMAALAARTAVDRQLWLAAMRRHGPVRDLAELELEGDRIAVDQLRKLTRGGAPRGATWPTTTRRDLGGGATAGTLRARLARRGGRIVGAFPRAARRRDR